MEQNETAKGTILIVDDLPINLKLLSELLEENGYTIIGAVDGHSAITMVKSQPIDLILLDIMLPDISGYEVCKQIKSDDHLCEIPIMFISALNEMFDKVHAFSLGGVDYITKPFQPEEVLARVQSHIRLFHLQQSLEHQNKRLHHEIVLRKDAESQLKKTHDELEIRIQERTSELMTTNNELKHEIFERKRAEKLLKVSEERYISLFDNMFNASAVFTLNDQDSFIGVAFNKSAQLFFGLDKSTLMEKSLKDLFSQSEFEEILPVFNHVLTTGEAQRYPLVTHSHDKIERWIELSVFKLPSGELVAIFHDDTITKQTKETLQTNNEVLERIFSTTHFSIVYLDSEFNYIRVNRAYADFIGHDMNYYYGKNHFDVFPYKDNQSIFKQVIQSGDNFSAIAMPFVSSAEIEERVTYWDWSLFPVKDAYGHIEGLIYVLRDVTDAKQAQIDLLKYQIRLEELVKERTAELEKTNNQLQTAFNSLRKSEHRYKTLFENSPIALWEVDFLPLYRFLSSLTLSGGEDLFQYLSQHNEIIHKCIKLIDIIDVNHETIKLYQAINKQDMIARMEHVFVEDSMDALINIFNSISEKKTTYECESIHQTLKKDPIDIHMCISLIQDNIDEEPFRGLISIRDITQSKRAEQELKKARDKAENAAKAKYEFLSMMSHEIRTPMNAVIGITDLLSRTPLSNQQKDYVHSIQTSGQALLNIINDILDFSKIDSNKLELDDQPIHILTCVKEVYQLLSIKANEKKLNLKYTVDPDVPLLIMGDDTRIRQILLNLVSNAIKYTQQGEIIIGVQQKSKINHQITLLFYVKDTGIGIPDNKINSLFQSFTQVDTSVTRKYGGTGLGLAICNRLVQMMNGSIWVDSQLDKGSTFYFTIETRIAEGPNQMDSLSHQPIEIDSEMGKRHPLSILLAEDNLMNQKVITNMLKEIGYRSDIVENGKQVLDAMRLKIYDVILMDIQMPEMDGVEATIRIRNDWSKDKQPRIIALTADALVGRREEYLSRGIDDYISKPVSVDRLIKSLNNCTKLSLIQEYGRLEKKQEGVKKSPINLKILYSMPGDINAYLEDYLTIFLNDTPKMIEKIETAISNQQAKPLQVQAHSLKSSCKLIGADAMAEVCLYLENAGKHSLFDDAKAHFPELKSSFQNVKLSLIHELEKIKDRKKNDKRI